MSHIEQIIARDAKYVDPLEEYNFPPTMGHAMRDRRYLLGRILALAADLARCRAANVYDGNAHRKVAEFEAALQRIAAYSAGLTPIPGDPIEIARTALETSPQREVAK